MTASISISCVLCFTLAQFFVLNIATSEFFISHNTKEQEFLHSSDRGKRSLFNEVPTTLRITIKYESNEQTELVLIKQWDILANQHLPVVGRFSNPHHNVMTEVGEFVLYQDLNKCCAVVYFSKAAALYGVIGMKYFIHGIPFAFDENGDYQLGVVGEPFVRKNQLENPHINPAVVFPPPFDADAWEDFFNIHKNVPTTNKRPIACEAGPSAKRPRTDQNNEGSDGEGTSKNTKPPRLMKTTIFEHFYFETLVIVTRDLAHLFKKHFGDDYITAIVRYHIIFFNAVDVITKQLGNLIMQVHINIGKVIIEDDSTPFEFISDGELRFIDVVDGVTEYLRNNQEEYPPDSFDYVFVHTRRAIMDYTMNVKALTRHGRDMYEARKQNVPYDAVPITVIQFENFYSHYAVAVHEIGRIFNMKITAKEVGAQSTGQCHDIMQREGPKCDNCLKWSDVNEKHFKYFFTYNRNRCFLLNIPRSTRPPGASRLITPHRQCQCFGYNSYLTYKNGQSKESVGSKQCREPMKCKKSSALNWNVETTIVPLDGTTCAHNKVCWNGLCEKLST